MNRIHAMMAGGAFVVGTALAGTAVVPALGANGHAALSPSDLNSDVHAAQVGETATANDTDTAAEKDVDNGAVDDRDVQDENAGVHEQDKANDGSTSDGEGQTGTQESGDKAADSKGPSQTGEDQHSSTP